MTEQATPTEESSAVKYTCAITAAFFSRNHVAVSEVSGVIRSVHEALTGLPSSSSADATAQKPAVPIKRSVTRDYIICLEDGKKLQMLKRYLRVRYNLSLDDYRIKWNLPPDYPMVAPAYSERRSALAKEAGLGVRTQKTTTPKRKRT